MDSVGRFETGFIRSSMPRQADPRILEIGTGPGRLASQFANPGSNFVGLDISSEMLKACGRRVGGTVSLVQSDASAGLPFKDSSFDFIYAIRSLKYATDFDKALKEIQRVIVPGGKFCFSVPNKRSINSINVHMHVPYMRTTVKEMKDKLLGHGFFIDEIVGGPKFPDFIYISRNQRLGLLAADLDSGLNRVFGVIASREMYISCRANDEA
jgi:SAM-dependent methyltransferase